NNGIIWDTPYDINDSGTYQDRYPLVSFIPNPIPPSEAPILQAITPNPSTNGNIQLNWNEITGATSFKVFRSGNPITSENASALTPIATPTSTSYLDSGLTNGTYYYAIVAVNYYGESDVSNCESVEVAIPPQSGNETPGSVDGFPTLIIILFITIGILGSVKDLNNPEKNVKA
ncbi:MAG: hypothetical protein ACTSRZ_21390, partial [Promethearchaeota archaeon]